METSEGLGYPAEELTKIEQEISERVGSWCHRFDGVVDRLLMHGDVMKPMELIRYAIEVADLMQEAVDRKKAG